MISCEKVVDIDVPFEKPMLVLNGFLNPDSSISVHVSKSQFILDEAELKNITDATITVFEEDKLLGQLMHQENGYYTLSEVKPQTGKSYEIKAEKSGLPSVSASHQVLSKVIPSNLKIDTIAYDEYGGTKLGIEFIVDDQEGQDNFYIVKVLEKGIGVYYQWYGKDERDTIREPYSIAYEIESSDPILESFCLDWNSCSLIVSDDYFDGKSYRFKITARSLGYYPEKEEVETFLVLYHIPESLYLFYKTLENNRSVSDNPFAEPAKVFTNVEGGFGLWTSLSPAVIKISR